MQCYTCHREVSLLRSVLLRHHTDDTFRPLHARFPHPTALVGDEEAEFQRLWAHCELNSQFRRTFICERCYKALDTFYGVGTIEVDGERQAFNLAGRSRAGNAAVYDQARWLRYQRKVAAEMGVSLTDETAA